MVFVGLFGTVRAHGVQRLTRGWAKFEQMLHLRLGDKGFVFNQGCSYPVLSFVKQQSFLPRERGIGLTKVFLGFFDTAASAGGKWNQNLALQLRFVVIQP